MTSDIFVTTSSFTTGRRDEAVEFIKNQYGWKLEIFGLERLRNLLEVTHPQVRDLHPQIFHPQLFPASTHPSSSGDRDRLFISYAPEERTLADWLARKLTAEGYRVWCEHLALLGGENYPDDVDDAIKNRTFRVIALYSQASLRNPEVMRQRAFALGIGEERDSEFVIPLNVDSVIDSQLDRKTRELTFMPFNTGWASGLQQLLKKLNTIECPKPLYDGKRLAVADFTGRDILSDQPEVLGSNCFPIEVLPEFILCFKADRQLESEILERVRIEWAFRRAGKNLLLGFQKPPEWFSKEYTLELARKTSWQKEETIEGISSRNLISELVRKSLLVKCRERGLKFCSDTWLFYFPQGLVDGDRLKFTLLDGSKTWVNSTGQRTLWRPQRSEEYKYYLAPTFDVVQNLLEQMVILIRVRIRISDVSGRALTGRAVNTRRKHLCSDWWNNDWFKRVLAISQFLSEDGKIIIGQNEERIVISGSPLTLTAPQGINEAALDELARERKELLEILEDDEFETEEIEDSGVDTKTLDTEVVQRGEDA